MRRLPPVAAALALVLSLSCAAAPAPLAEDATAQEIVQRAQEASDRRAWKEAIAGYRMLIDRWGSDPALLCAGEYEIALILYKQGKYAESKALLEGILARYEGPGAASLPPRYAILAGKVLPEVDARLGPGK